ncbi:unnamed protein product, partial [Brassica oleracea]
VANRVFTDVAVSSPLYRLFLNSIDILESSGFHRHVRRIYNDVQESVSSLELRIRQGSGPVKLIDLSPLLVILVSCYGVPDVLSLEVCLIYSSLYCLAWAASPISNLFSVFTSSIKSGEAFLRRVSGGSSYSTSSISFVCLCRRVFKLWLVLLKIEECESDLFDLLELVGLEALLVCGRLFSTGWVVPLCVKLQDVKLCYSLVCNRGFPEFLILSYEDSLERERPADVIMDRQLELQHEDELVAEEELVSEESLSRNKEDVIRNTLITIQAEPSS